MMTKFLFSFFFFLFFSWKSQAIEHHSCSIKLSSTIDFSHAGELRTRAGDFEYVLNLCKPIEGIKGCEGSHICQIPENSTSGVSLGKDKFGTLHSHSHEGDSGKQIAFHDGHPGCANGHQRITHVSFRFGKKVRILSVREGPPCRYEINVEHPSGPCTIDLIHEANGKKNCMKDVSYGCSGEHMWISGECAGEFLCNRINVVKCEPGGDDQNVNTKCSCHHHL